MSSDESVDDAQTKTCTTRSCSAPRGVTAPEALEDAGLVLHGDAGAVVGNPHLGPGAIPLHAHPGRGSDWSVRAHVGKQVVNGLSQADGIPDDHRRTIEIAG
jgi:hypothetical protein